MHSYECCEESVFIITTKQKYTSSTVYNYSYTIRASLPKTQSSCVLHMKKGLPITYGKNRNQCFPLVKHFFKWFFLWILEAFSHPENAGIFPTPMMCTSPYGILKGAWLDNCMDAFNMPLCLSLFLHVNHVSLLTIAWLSEFSWFVHLSKAV